MNIGLDFDGTFDRDPALWQDFSARARRNGHKVFIVTLRHPDNDKEVKRLAEAWVDGVIYCSYRSKREVCAAQNLTIHVWIDDMPETIGMGDKGVSLK